MKEQLYSAAQTTLNECLGLQPTETLLIISDDDTPAEIVNALYAVARTIGSEVLKIQILPREFNGQELPPAVSAALLECDVFLGPTSKSFSHTESRRVATRSGVRGATLPGITQDIFERLMSADYQQMQEKAQNLLKQINPASNCRITTPAGTDLYIELEYDFEPDDGNLKHPGAFGNLPAGEVMGAPSNSHGIVVIEHMGEIITEPTKIEIKNNRILRIEDNSSGKKLQDLLEAAASKDHNRNAFHVAELGIGLNSKAQISGNILEDEKVKGTCHIAFGDNSSYPGGTNVSSIHIDGVITQPSITLDNPQTQKTTEVEH